MGYTQNTKHINPSGTYTLNAHIRNQENIYGSYGDLQIKLIESNSIVVSLFYCKGEPSYNSGSFIDTITYINNISHYIPNLDSLCTLSFYFTDSNVYINQKSDVNVGACGFGYGVYIDDIYNKASSESPIIKDFLTDEIIK